MFKNIIEQIITNFVYFGRNQMFIKPQKIIKKTPNPLDFPFKVIGKICIVHKQLMTQSGVHHVQIIDLHFQLIPDNIDLPNALQGMI